MDVIVSFGTGAYVRQDHEPVWQQPVSTIYVGTAPRVVITGTTSELVLSTGTVDVSADVPAAIADDHAAIVAWWSAEVERQEAEQEMIRLEAEREDAVRRLARKARAEGVQLYHDAKDGRHYTSSVSTPGRMYYVTGVSCDCMGFASHGRCKHHSAMLVALGWVVDTTFEPDPISIAGTRHEYDGAAA
jgi:hypothetical protein